METANGESGSLIERVERLEKQNRRMKQVGAAALLLAGALFLMGQAAPKRTVEANEFILKDASGRLRGTWWAHSEGAILELYDSDGKPRIGLGVNKVGAALSVYNAQSHDKIDLVQLGVLGRRKQTQVVYSQTKPVESKLI